MKKLIIAIDGPSGVGKSTLSKRLAGELGYVNLDTGAMYRAVTLAARRRGIDPVDAPALVELCRDIAISFDRQGPLERVLLDGEDVSEAIRTPENSQLTPLFAACPEVREAMVRRQRELGREGGVVLEGRDIGTVVFPLADVKFFLAATADERGRRRYLELRDKGVDVDLAQTVVEVEARDDADSSRAASPLCQAEDARVIDTTKLSIDEVLAEMLETVKAVARGV
jgi:cytidylate kinase